MIVKVILKKLTAVLLAVTLVLGAVIIGVAAGDYDSDLGFDFDDDLGFDFDGWDDFDHGGFAGVTPSIAIGGVPVDAGVYVSAGGRHAFVLNADGSLWGWGNNADGQLGDGTRRARPQSHPWSVGEPAAAWARVSTGENHTVGIRANGSLWGWGRNSSGQLGDGTTTAENRPCGSAQPMIG